MKKTVFSLAIIISSSLSTLSANAQVLVKVKIGTPTYCPPPVKIVVAPPLRKNVIVVKPAPVVVVRARPLIIVPQPPVYVATKPSRKIVIYR